MKNSQPFIVTVSLPFGEGFAKVIREYTPPEYPNEFSQGDSSEFNILSVKLGGVEILEELLDKYVPYIDNGNVKYDFFLEKWRNHCRPR